MGNDWKGFSGHSANPYPVPELRLEDRPGYPFNVSKNTGRKPAGVAPAVGAVEIGWLFKLGERLRTRHD